MTSTLRHIILSRKGWDTSYGRSPSMILLDKRMISLPIPETDQDQRGRALHQVRYEEISFPGAPNMGSVVQHVTRRRRPVNQISGDDAAHLDPDIRADAVPRDRRNWRAVYGQNGGHQSELDRLGVGKGDLFLFYGLYREAVKSNNLFDYVAGTKPRHILWGWLSIGEVIPVPHKAAAPRWTWYHPHVVDHAPDNNVIYIQSDSCLGGLPGAGTFSYSPELELTCPGKSCSVWSLPPWFDPARTEHALTRNCDRKRWERRPDGRWQLKTTSPGQEYVFDGSVYPEALPWIAGLIRAHGQPTVVPRAATHSF